jgi:capsular exopolysaccharide synthesis family protein
MIERARVLSAAPSEPLPLPPQAAPPSLPAPEGRHLLDYVRVLYKRRRLALAVLLAVVSLVTWITLRAVPIYEAKVQILIEPENRNIVLFKEVIEQPDVDKDYEETQHRILQSRSLARRTLEELQLWDDRELGTSGATEIDTVANVRGVASKVVSAIKRPFRSEAPPATPASAPANTSPEAETGLQARVIDGFLSRLTVTPVRNSRLVDVKMRSRDPEKAARLVNALAENYKDQNMETKLGASKQASDWLAQQLEEQRKQVEKSEVALQQYREKSGALSLDEPNNIVVQKLTDLNTAVTEAKTARIEKEAVFRYAQSVSANPEALNSVPAIIANAYVQQLRAELLEQQRQMLQQREALGERHPEMIKLRATIELSEQKLRGEVERVLGSLESQFEAAKEQENRLVGALEAQKAEALALNRKAIDYGTLQREATSNRQIFETLLQRTRETGISGELKSNNIQIVDAADVPRSPVWPRTWRNIMLSFVGGLLLAIVLAFFVDYLDSSIRSPDEIRTELGLPLLGLVPVVPAKNLEGKSPLINNGVPAKFAEAVRTVRTNVLLADDMTAHALVVTSTGPKEGKTVVASNLAIALAQAGLRVILVDADLRRPRVHEIFEFTQEPGLSDLLSGKTSAYESCRMTSTPGLWLLPAGFTEGNPADLLGSPRFRECLRTLRQQFEWVIIDSPPVLAVTDASLIAHIASGVLFVVGADRTSRQAAHAALEQLESARAPFLGGVLNAVDLEQDSFFFAKYYRPEYGTYYTPNTPNPPKPARQGARAS